MLMLKNGAKAIAFTAMDMGDYVAGVVLAHWVGDNSYVTWRFHYQGTEPALCEHGHYFGNDIDGRLRAWEDFRKRSDHYIEHDGVPDGK